PSPTVFYSLSLHDALPIFDVIGYDNWSMSGPQGRFTLIKNKQWLFERVNRGDEFWLVSNPNTLSSRFGQGEGYYTTMELKWLERSEEHTSELQSRGHLVCR